MTSAALALDEDPGSLELTVVGNPALEAPADGLVRTRLFLALMVLVQVVWLAGLGYGVLALV